MNTVAVESIDLLQQHFGWNAFKPGQQTAIDHLLGGQSALAVFPTGGGKSLCYQLPALAFDGLTVVVSPLIALMKDQIDQLAARGIEARRLDSSLTNAEYREAMEAIRSGQSKILYVAPERFFNERFRSSLEGIKISLFAVDEAHCISQWGHSFRPDYLKLAKIADKLNVERILALTATATPTVQADIIKEFSIPAENAVCTEFFRPNLQLCTRICNESDRDNTLIDLIKSRPAGPAIVYVSLQQTAVDVAEKLTKQGFNAQPYHAGFDAVRRNEVQDSFMASNDGIVVATIAFGMGIDKSDIRYVYHYNPPKSIENYAQEIGRAGRDGEASICQMLLVPQDRIVLENFVYGDTPSLESLELMMQELRRQPDEFFISQYTLSSNSDIRKLVVQTLLTYLELDGFLEGTSPRYDSYEFIPSVPSDTIVNHFQGERQNFVRSLLASSHKKAKWFSIDIEQVCQKLNTDRARVVKAFDFFAEKEWMTLKTSKLVHGYRRLKPIPTELARDYFEKMKQREASEVLRIDQVFQLANAEICQAAIVSEHFGQPLDAECGICSFCQNELTDDVLDLTGSNPDTASIPESILQLALDLKQKHPSVFTSARVMARFLAGLRSPALTRAKLSRDKNFGCCSEIPFKQLQRELEQVL
ncbi:MAG: RecQ family ATP-dependent DNA helicase [Planctomycetota bacterium]